MKYYELKEAEEKKDTTKSDLDKAIGMLAGWAKAIHPDTDKETFDKMRNDTWALLKELK